MKRLICLDLDGTLVESHLVDLEAGDGKTKLGPRSDRAFTEPVLLPGRKGTIMDLAATNYAFAIVTNQGGVAWGYCNEPEARLRIARAVAELEFFYGAPFSVHVSFCHPRATMPGYKDDGGRRKPSGVMIREAMEVFRTDSNTPLERADETLMVGDRPEDEQAAADAGVQFVQADEFFERLG